MGCLANLSENKETHPFLLGPEPCKPNTPPFLCSFACDLVGHADAALVREVTRLLTNLSGNYECHPRLMASALAAYDAHQRQLLQLQQVFVEI